MNNRITAFFFTFNNILVPLVTMAFLYLALSANEQVQNIPIIGSKFLPSFAVNGFIALSVVILALFVLGYAGGVTESKAALEAYSFILAVSILLMISYSGLLTYYSGVFSTYY